MGDRIEMSSQERERLVELRRVERGDQSQAEAARRLGLSARQLRRVWVRYQREGAKGLVHRGRGRVSNRSKGEGFREACLRLCRERLEGFGPTLAAEKLVSWGYAVDAETVRRWWLAAGMWQRRRKRSQHRRFRARREWFGELVQLDGSLHDWWGDGRRRCLINAVDDATGTTLARLFEEETTEGAMRAMWAWIERYGVPGALYVDLKSVYVTAREPTLQEQLRGEEPATAFGRACRKLGIGLVEAHSPQAKGRVERSHGVYQDRFVKELRLRGIHDLVGANALLEGGFVDELNRKFARPPLRGDAHRPVPKSLPLAAVFLFEELRSVQNDWTVRYENRWYQLTGRPSRLPPARGTVTVQRYLDGSLHIVYRGQEMSFHEISKPAPLLPPAPTIRRKPTRPAADHPWRQTARSRTRDHPRPPIYRSEGASAP